MHSSFKTQIHVEQQKFHIMKKNALLFLLSLSCLYNAQVGINTQNPQGVLDIKNKTGQKNGVVLPIVDDANNTLTPSGSTAVESTLVYDQGLQCIRVKTGTGWSNCLIDQSSVSITALGSTYWVANSFSTSTESLMQKKFSANQYTTVFGNAADKGYITGAGYTIYGLGVPGTGATVSPAKRLYKSNVLTVSGSNLSHVMVSTDGKVFVTGFNQNGKLGTGNTSNLDTWQQVTLTGAAADEKAIQVQTAPNATIILTDKGFVYSAGTNIYGQTGLGTTTGDTTTFTKIPTLNNVKSIWGGDDSDNSDMFTAITNDSKVYAWGNYLGAGLSSSLGSNGYKPTPIDITASFAAATSAAGVIKKVMIGHNGTLAMFSNGTIWAAQSVNVAKSEIGLGSGLATTSELQDITSYITMDAGEKIVDFDLSDNGGVIITSHYVWRYGLDNGARFSNAFVPINTWSKLNSEIYDGEIFLTSVDLVYNALLVGTGLENSNRIIVSGDNTYNKLGPSSNANISTPTYGLY